MAEIRIRNQGKITVQDADSSNEVSLQAPSTVASNQEFTLPSTSGSANNIITTNASGVLSMTDISTLITSDIAWQSSVKTGDFTAVSGEGYFVNTTSGAVTVTLPSSPSAGDFVAFKDYAETFATNNLTINRNGSNIQGNANNSLLNTNRASVVLIYVDSTEGWLYTVENNVGDLENKQYVTATGGTITTSGDYKIHTFDSSGTFTVSNAGNSAGSNKVDYMVIAGGGGGGSDNNAGGGVGSGGGGAGGFRESVPNPAAWTASPLASSGGSLSVPATAYPITIGAGGTSGPAPGGNGSAGGPSVFSTITSAGGGAGLGNPNTPTGDGSGGSGGGGTYNASGGSGNTPPVSPPQGNSGESGAFSGQYPGGAGGGAGESGGTDGDSYGGDGVTTNISASPVTFAGGGGGGKLSGTSGPGGDGGGGAGGPVPGGNGTAGTANTGGGGGGGAGHGGNGATGGAGKIIIRYKYQN